MATAESATPIAYGVFEDTKVQENIATLEDWNRKFETSVLNSEELHGVLPEKEPAQNPPAPASTDETHPWVAPVVIGAVALAIVAAIWGKK